MVIIHHLVYHIYGEGNNTGLSAWKRDKILIEIENCTTGGNKKWIIQDINNYDRNLFSQHNVENIN